MNRVPLEEVEKRLIFIHEDKVRIVFYAPSKEKSQFICERGHTWYASLASVLRGNKCPECRKLNMREKFAFTHEQIEQKIKELGRELVSGTYVNAFSELEVKCICGNIYKTIWNTLQSGKGCPVCGREKASSSMRLSEKEAIDKVNSSGLKFINFNEEYKDSKTKANAECEFGHITTQSVNEFKRRPYCKTCNKKEVVKAISGPNSTYWKGGCTAISEYLKKQITQWKKDSIKNCDYKCVITGERFEAVHHLYSFNTIVQDAFKETKIPIQLFVSDYSEEELEILTKKVIELHYKHPLGVCLTKKIHSIFHSIYGSGNNTVEQWEEFKANYN